MTGEELLKLADVKRLQLKPGDALAVYCKREPTDYEADWIRERLTAHLGGEIKVIVLPPSYDLGVIGSEVEDK